MPPGSGLFVQTPALYAKPSGEYPELEERRMTCRRYGSSGRCGFRRTRRSEALGELLQAIAGQDGPWRGFALHIGFGDLRLPDVGYVAVPIRLHGRKARRTTRELFDITFSSVEPPRRVSDVQRTDRASSLAASASARSILRGRVRAADADLRKVLDKALTPNVATNVRSKTSSTRSPRRCQARVDAREAEFARYHFYAQTLR